MVVRVLVPALLLIRAAFAQDAGPEQLFREAAEAQQHGDDALAVDKYQALIKLRPDIVTEAPAPACVELTFVTLGPRSTTSKLVNSRLLSPWAVSWMSSSFHVRANSFATLTEWLAPVR